MTGKKRKNYNPDIHDLGAKEEEMDFRIKQCKLLAEEIENTIKGVFEE